MARSLKRFFTPQILSSSVRTVALGEEESHHLKKVLRLKEGDSCLVFDSAGNEWLGKVVKNSGKKSAQVQLLEPTRNHNAVECELVIAQAIPQRSKMDVIVEKAAELGIPTLIPMISERTVVRIKKEDEPKVLARWAKIVSGARKQSCSRAEAT